MAENVLNKVVQLIDADTCKKDRLLQLVKATMGFDKIYSYIVFARKEEEKLLGWRIEYNISQTDTFNTIKTYDALKKILFALDDVDNPKKVVCFKQPPLELMVKLYEPLVKKLSKQQSNKWRELEYDDAYQLCMMTMVNLYNKNYYIHKNLLEKSYYNEILLYLRKDLYKPNIVSLDDIVVDKGEEVLTVASMIPDKKAIIEAEDEAETALMMTIFADVKDLIIDYIGERQFKQLFRDYSNKNTTGWSRKKLQDIKKYFNSLGITWEILVNFRTK